MINRNLGVGLFILGAMSHYDNEEVLKHKSIQYIAATLKKKHFSLKNGTAKERFNRDLEAMQKRLSKWNTHKNISDKAWKRAADSFDATNAITVSGLILAILRKEPAVAKWYGFNQKKMEKFQLSSEFKNMHVFRSSKVATKLLEHLDSEISYFNYNK